MGHRREGNRGNEQAVFEAVNPIGLGGVSDLSIYACVASTARAGTRGCTNSVFQISFIWMDLPHEVMITWLRLYSLLSEGICDSPGSRSGQASGV